MSVHTPPSAHPLTLPANASCARPVVGAWGDYNPATGAIRIHPALCDAMQHVLDGRYSRVQFALAAQGVRVVGHEEEHAAGVMDDTAANCASLADFATTARRLGFTWRVIVPLAAIARQGATCPQP